MVTDPVGEFKDQCPGELGDGMRSIFGNIGDKYTSVAGGFFVYAIMAGCGKGNHFQGRTLIENRLGDFGLVDDSDGSPL